jgi:hypothetical protein
MSANDERDHSLRVLIMKTRKNKHNIKHLKWEEQYSQNHVTEPMIL